MEKVSILPIDLGKSSDFKGVSFTSTYNNKDNSRNFSQELNKQIFNGNSGNNKNVSGNRGRSVTINEQQKAARHDERTAQSKVEKNRNEDNRITEQRLREKRIAENQARNDHTLENRSVNNKLKKENVAKNQPSAQKTVVSKPSNNDTKMVIDKTNGEKKTQPQDDIQPTDIIKKNKITPIDDTLKDSSVQDDEITESEQLIALLQNAEKTLVKSPTELVDEANSETIAHDEVSDNSELTKPNESSDDLATLLQQANNKDALVSSDKVKNSDDINIDLLQQLKLSKNTATQLDSLKAKTVQQPVENNELLNEKTQLIDESEQLLSGDDVENAKLAKFLQDIPLKDKSLSREDVTNLLKKYLDNKSISEDKGLGDKLTNALTKGLDIDTLKDKALNDDDLQIVKGLLKTLSATENNKSVNKAKIIPTGVVGQTNLTQSNNQTSIELSNFVSHSDEVTDGSEEKDLSAELSVMLDSMKTSDTKKVNANLLDNASQENLANTKVNTLLGESASGSAYSKEELQNIQSLHASTNKILDMNAQTQKAGVTSQMETIALYRKDFTSALQDKVMVMVQQKIRQVDIRLDPPELGSMQVRLNLQNEQASVHFIVQHQQAKEVLDQNMPKLRDMLAEQGVNVGDTNVGHHNAQAENENEQGQFTQQGSHFINEEIDESVQVLTANYTKNTASGVDYYA
jgi:flagellar hook-length control protein FliK